METALQTIRPTPDTSTLPLRTPHCNIAWVPADPAGPRSHTHTGPLPLRLLHHCSRGGMTAHDTRPA